MDWDLCFGIHFRLTNKEFTFRLSPLRMRNHIRNPKTTMTYIYIKGGLNVMTITLWTTRGRPLILNKLYIMGRLEFGHVFAWVLYYIMPFNTDPLLSFKSTTQEWKKTHKSKPKNQNPQIKIQPKPTINS